MSGPFMVEDSGVSRVTFGNGSSVYDLRCGDNRVVLSRIADNSVDLVVTSPPYFSQREYSSIGLGNEETIEEYLDNIIETFKQIVRVVKPTGNIVYNIGDKIINGCLQLVVSHVWNRRCSWEVIGQWQFLACPNPYGNNCYFSVD